MSYFLLFICVFCVIRGLKLLMFMTEGNRSVLEVKSKITHDYWRAV